MEIINNIENYIFSNQFEIFDKLNNIFDSQLSLSQIPSKEKLVSLLCLELGEPQLKEFLLNNNIIKNWFDLNYDLSFLDPIFKLENLEEIIIHNNNEIYLQLKNHLEVKKIESKNSLNLEILAKYLSIKASFEWNYNKPFSSFYLKLFNTNLRIGLVHQSILGSTNSKIFIRVIRNKNINIDSFSNSNIISEKIIELFQSKKNIIFCGATNSGKTTIMSSLLNMIENNEHVITLEDTKELPIKNHFTSLLSRDKGQGLVEFCHYSLRMKPDRIILGEIRSKEVVPLILSMNTGHNGIMTTVHANNAFDCIHRISTLFTLFSDSSQVKYEQVIDLVCSAIHYIVYLENKKINQIYKIIGSNNGKPIVDSLIE